MDSFDHRLAGQDPPREMDHSHIFYGPDPVAMKDQSARHSGARPNFWAHLKKLFSARQE